MDIYEGIERFAAREKEEAEKAKAQEKNRVSIDPESYIASER